MTKIAISLSGGGFRAATFHLGTLSYLNRLKTSNGKPLLDYVNTVSTISGGTLTGLWFLWGKCKGMSNDDILSGLDKILKSSDVIGKASREFLNGDNLNHSLIREMIRIYDEEIFHNATLGDIMAKIDDISIDNFSANATEFTNATEFRFQVGKVIETAKGGFSQGVIGNIFYKIPPKIAQQIKLSEVFAASSCFPGGFEALFYPRDFNFSKDPINKEYVNSVKPLAIMDGGIVDNQGIEPVNLIRKRQNIDLFIISDAGCGKEDPYTFEESDTLSSISIHRLNIIQNIIIAGFASLLLFVPKGYWTGFVSAALIIFQIIRISIALSSRILLNKTTKNIPFTFNWKGLLHINFAKIRSLIGSRATSMIKLTDNVFMKHIRTLNYNTIYQDSQWRNRRIMNALYELCRGKSWGKHLTPEERKIMEPTEAVSNNSDIAASMGTTLWWSEKDRIIGKPAALIAAGQYNICWNLLEYIYRLRRDKTNTTEEHKLIEELQEQLEADWNKFKENPQFLADISKI